MKRHVVWEGRNSPIGPTIIIYKNAEGRALDVLYTCRHHESLDVTRQKMTFFFFCSDVSAATDAAISSIYLLYGIWIFSLLINILVFLSFLKQKALNYSFVLIRFTLFFFFWYNLEWKIELTPNSAELCSLWREVY